MSLPSESSAAYTPSPWSLEETDSDVLLITIPAPVGCRVIAEIAIGFDEPWDSQQHANVHLISAAPDLLQALKDVLACIGTDGPLPEQYELALDAIAKAEGRS